jgi:hypothetical protein
MRHIPTILCTILTVSGFAFLWLDNATHALACFYTALVVFAFLEKQMKRAKPPSQEPHP